MTDDDVEKDRDVARMSLADAEDALEEGNVLEVIEALGHVLAWASRAEQRDRPIATAKVERAGDHTGSWTDFYPGEAKEIEVDGKATVRVKVEEPPWFEINEWEAGNE